MSASGIRILGPEFDVYADNLARYTSSGPAQFPTSLDLEALGVTSLDHKKLIMAEICNVSSSNPLKSGLSKPQSSHTPGRAFFRNPFSTRTHSCMNANKSKNRTPLESARTRTSLDHTGCVIASGSSPGLEKHAIKHEPAEKTTPASIVIKKGVDVSISPPNIPLANSLLTNNEPMVFLSYARGDIATPFTMWLCKTLQVSTLSSASSMTNISTLPTSS